MYQKIKNTLHITVKDVNLKTLRKIEFYIRQGELFFEYIPTIINEHEMSVIIPKIDADFLKANEKVELQFCYTDENDNDVPSKKSTVDVEELLKTEGYNGN